MYHGAYHLPVGDFFSTYVVTGGLYPVIRHGEALGQVTAACGQFCGSQRKAYF